MAYTNKGLYHRDNVYYRNAAEPTNFYVALCTNATPPTQDTNTLGQLTEIAAGNGYTTGGYQLARNSTDFDVLTEDDTNDRSFVQVKNVVFTAAGGPIPLSGSGARWAVFTDDNATIANREVFTYWDLGSDRSVTDGNPLTIADLTFRSTGSP